jgi:RND family efflux transporter MFP subunit
MHIPQFFAPARTGLLCLSLLTPHAWAQSPAAAPAAAATPISVSVARLDSVWVQPEREAPATVLARNVSRLSAESAGTLQRWTADVGARVQRGQVLAQIDPRDAELGVQRAQSAVDASQARLDLAQAQLKRSEELVAQGFYSQEALLQRQTELNLMRSELQNQRAQLATAQRQLNKTTLRAPFAGTVQERLAQTGEAVSPGSVLYVLVEAGPTEVQAQIDPIDARSLQQATRIWLQTSRGDEALRLLRLSSTINTPARTQTARLTLVNGANAAGTTGTLRWQDPQAHIPSAYIVKRKDQLGVFVQQGAGSDAKARFVPLPGAQEGRPSPAPKALAGNTALIVQGQLALQDQTPIAVR